MNFGAENATRLTWRNTPDLLLNEESLVDVISKLRIQVQTLEKNELLSGTALPPWLLKALTEVASNVDTVVECQALHDQVASMQKEMLELRHELLLQQSNNSFHGGGGGAALPTPFHRLATSKLRSTPSQKRMSDGVAINAIRKKSIEDLNREAESSTTSSALEATTSSSISIEHLLKPIWDCLHRQMNEFSSLREAFSEAKDTVARLQSEIKRRDAVVQARNNKHETMVQTQVDKLNESLRTCVTRNDLIGAEQRIAQQMKVDRQRLVNDIEARSNKILEDLLGSRAEQEDINSMHAETMQVLTRKQTRLEELFTDLNKRYYDAQDNTEIMKQTLEEVITKLETNTTLIEAMETKTKSLEDTQQVVSQLTIDIQAAVTAHENLRAEIEVDMVEKIAESVATVRNEVEAVNGTVKEIVNQNLDSEIKSVMGKIDMVGLSVADCVRKISVIQKQNATTEEQNRLQLTQAFDSIDKISQNVSTLSEESMRNAYDLQQTMKSGEELTQELHGYRERTDQSIETLQKFTQDLQTSLDRSTKVMENEISVVKNQLFHVEDVTSTLKREIEETRNEVDQNFRTQHQENKSIHGLLERLDIAKEEITARQDSAERQLIASQAENRAEIQAATVKLVAVVDKESDRIEALYASFQEKQEHFADVMARSSIRNMELSDMNREIDRVCEIFVSECWKFEISARSSNKGAARSVDNNNNASAARKLFNERQQQLLVRNCQFIADLIVARAEYEVLHMGCNKEIKNQHDLEMLMLEQQAGIVDKVKVKMNTKIMNNKNIGEQFDKSSLDRRELYIETISNMLNASMKRRTMGNFDSEPAHYTTTRKNSIYNDNASSGGPFLETQRLATTGVAGNGTLRRKGSALDCRPQAVSGLPADTEISRTAFSPGATHIFRAGFRLPKASPPTSPMYPIRRSTMSSSLGSTSRQVSGEDIGDASIFLTSPPEETDVIGDGIVAHALSHDNLNGWPTTDEKNEQENLMAKSYSLPVLKQ